MSETLHNRLLAALDRDDAVSLLRGAIGCNSVTGKEANMVAYLDAQMRERGLADIEIAEFLPGRPNIWGRRKGSGGGKRLQFIGHTDTVHVEGWREHYARTCRLWTERLAARREDLHVVVTGRNARPALVEAADLVTEMGLVKHHFAAGVKAQAGVEF